MSDSLLRTACRSPTAVRFKESQLDTYIGGGPGGPTNTVALFFVCKNKIKIIKLLGKGGWCRRREHSTGTPLISEGEPQLATVLA
jgi:hypothetical protein